MTMKKGGFCPKLDPLTIGETRLDEEEEEEYAYNIYPKI